jgi:aldose 1-epimerase
MPRHSQSSVFQLSNGIHSLAVAPIAGGSVASWRLHQLPWSGAPFSTPLDIWRPGSLTSREAISMASMPLLPWCNRISQGGFKSGQGFHSLTPNLSGEVLPIHGDGFLQAWHVTHVNSNAMRLQLLSQCFHGNPHAYIAEQAIELVKDGMHHTLRLEHLGKHPLPYGIGQHPWFLNQTATRLQADVTGMWLCDSQVLPTVHTQVFEPDKDVRHSVSTSGSLIDNLYDGWNGQACIDYPAHHLKLSLKADLTVGGDNKPCYLMVYRPPHANIFCIEPVSHPVDAFNQPGQPGLHWLNQGESMCMQLTWRFMPMT